MHFLTGDCRICQFKYFCQIYDLYRIMCFKKQIIYLINIIFDGTHNLLLQYSTSLIIQVVICMNVSHTSKISFYQCFLLPFRFIQLPLKFFLFLQQPLRPLSTIISSHKCASRDVTFTTKSRASIARHLWGRTWRMLIIRHLLVQHNRALIVRQYLIRHSTH